MFAIARRLLAYYYRKGRIEQRAIRRLGGQLDPVGDDDHQRLIDLAGLGALRDQLAAGLAELSDRERDALDLRVVQSSSTRQSPRRWAAANKLHARG